MRDTLVFVQYGNHTLDLWFGDGGNAHGNGWDVPDPVINALPPDSGTYKVYHLDFDKNVVLWTNLPHLDRLSQYGLLRIHAEVVRVITEKEVIPVHYGESDTLVFLHLKKVPVNISSSVYSSILQ